VLYLHQGLVELELTVLFGKQVEPFTFTDGEDLLVRHPPIPLQYPLLVFGAACVPCCRLLAAQLAKPVHSFRVVAEHKVRVSRAW